MKIISLLLLVTNVFAIDSNTTIKSFRKAKSYFTKFTANAARLSTAAVTIKRKKSLMVIVAIVIKNIKRDLVD